MRVVVVGNGILGLMTAYSLVEMDPSVQIAIVGPELRPGCATLAAAAMFNSFCEVDAGTFKNKWELLKFEFNRLAAPRWPALLETLEAKSKSKISSGFGTFLVNNMVTDSLEDRNFLAVLNALARYKEPHELIEAHSIPQYRPTAQGRAARAVHIPHEGWVNPVHLIEALQTVLKRKSQVQWINAEATQVKAAGGEIQTVLTTSGEEVSGDKFFLAPGARFTGLIEKSNLGLDFQKIFFGVGASVLLKTQEDTLKNCVRTPNRGLACGIYAAPQDSQHTLVGASNFISPVPEFHARVTSVHTLLKSAMEQINQNFYRAQLLKVNVGWRPTSEDTMPLLGATSIKNLFVATGTKRDGLHCSPIIGQHMAELMLGKKLTHTFTEFHPERKPIRAYTRQEALDILVRHTLNAHYQHGFTPSHDRIEENLEKHYTQEFARIHDQAGAHDWGIPPELINMYKYEHIQS